MGLGRVVEENILISATWEISYEIKIYVIHYLLQVSGRWSDSESYKINFSTVIDYRTYRVAVILAMYDRSVSNYFAKMKKQTTAQMKPHNFNTFDAVS